MNYYERHLGDYAKDTAHLTMLEHGAYSLLLDRYYGTEQGIPEDQAHRIARARSREEKQAVDTVLQEFFILEGGIWINNRAEEEIARAQTRIQAAKENGKRGGRPKHNPTQTQQEPSGLSLGSNSETQSKPYQTPDTINLEPNGSKSKRATRACQLPAEFYPSETGVVYADKRKLNLAIELESFRNWHVAKGSAMKDWQAAWRTWCDKAVEFGRGGNRVTAAAGKDESRRKAYEGLTGRRSEDDASNRNTIDINPTAVTVG